MQGNEQHQGDEGGDEQPHRRRAVELPAGETHLQVGARHLGADDHHGQRGVEVGHKAHGVVHHGGEPKAGEEEKAADDGAHGGGVDEDGPGSYLAPHGLGALGPQQEVEGHGGDHPEDHGLLAQNGIDQRKTHKPVVAVGHAEAERRLPVRLLVPKAQLGHPHPQQGGDGVHHEEDPQRLHHAGHTVHLKGVDHQAGGDHVKHQGGHLGDAVGVELAQLGHNEAHAHK